MNGQGKGVGHHRGKPSVNVVQWGQEIGKELADLSRVSMERLVIISQRVGEFLATGKDKETNEQTHLKLKTAQIRRFLDAARRIDADLKSKPFDDVKDSIVLLRPKLAYAAGREKMVHPLMNVLDPAIQSATFEKSHFEKLLRLVESIIAYHKYKGGD